MHVSVGVWRCALAAVLFGAATPLASRLAVDTSAPALAGLLYVGAALGVAPFVRGAPPTDGLRRERASLILAVGLGGFLAPLLLAAGLARTDGATASLLLNLELVSTILLAALLFREHLGRAVAAGAMLVVASSVVLGTAGTPDLRTGALLIAAACACWGVDNCVTANVVALSPSQLTFAKGAIAGSTNVALAAVTGASFPDAAGIAGAVAIGVVGYGVSITLWVQGARDLGAARGQVIFAAAPFAGVVVAWGVLGEPVVTEQLVGLGLASAGIVLVLRSSHHHQHEHLAMRHTHEHSHDDGHHHHGHDTAPRHTHTHDHAPVAHAHPHVPDLHHRHDHERTGF